jgi:hypothetical protein
MDELVTAIDRARVACDRFVIIEAGPYFAQFMPNFRALYGEVVSNTFLDGADRLTFTQDCRLVRRGWGRPGQLCHPDCPSDFHPMYTRIWESAALSRVIARDLLEGLMIVSSSPGEGSPIPIVKSGVRVTRPTSGGVPGH